MRTAAITFAGFLVSTMASAMMVDIPLRSIVVESDLIVLGKVVSTGKKAHMELPLPRLEKPVKRWFQTSMIEVKKVLKDRYGAVGKRKAGQRVPVVYWARAPQGPGPRIFMADGPAYPNLRTGQEYLLCLKKMPKGDGYYLEAYPKNYIQVTPGTAQRVAQMERMADTSSWDWGPAVAGLRMAFVPDSKELLLVKGRRGGPRGPVFQYAYLRYVVAIQNVSDKKVAVNLYPGDKLLTMTMVDERKTRHFYLYQWLARARLKPFGPEFVAITEPGQIALVVPHGRGSYGSGLRLKTNPGKKIISMNYASQRQGKTQDGTPLWVGKLTAKLVELNVIKPRSR